MIVTIDSLVVAIRVLAERAIFPEAPAHLVVAAVFKTVAPCVQRAVGGFDSHALPLEDRMLCVRTILRRFVATKDLNLARPIRHHGKARS